MDPAAQSELLASFTSVTQSTADQARFFLESAGWDLERAIETFFETGGAITEDQNDMIDMDAEEAAMAAAEPPAPTLRPAGAAAAAEARATQARAQPPPRARPAPGNIRGFGDLGAQGNEDDSDDEGTEYFTGGEKSGMMVQDPSKKKQNPSDQTTDGLFDKLRQSGNTVSEEELAQRSAAQNNRFFTGSARTLGSAAEPSQEVQAAAAGGMPSRNQAPIIHNVVFYNNGFVVNGGPLRRPDDPANAAFLQSIQKGECPDELKPEPGKQVNVEARVQRENKDYEPPPEPKYKAFSGTGQSLGSSSSGASASASAPPPPSQPNRKVVIDDSAPVTSLQIRLHDGTRMVAKFNHTHTVQDIQQVVRDARPDMPANFQLMTSYPPTALTNVTQTIKDAGLVGAVVLTKV
mmetsp:Transcript_36256/g.43765  ORF Transcript_36256/g.43765 Transcript_36256/m.43765 type:complete len:406 (-) Transcript_36256:488-1705(-)|eukprot:CAMPEP_0197851444 /NCGR_PEP_ID=MMETSP1438-20131217/18112_1 /TAXON_ID=1461541 /ORGANISM="Pterosperma sp., Strain CCMP1384" /LENGTH=405 /DNA_ID=CAMNT_0043465047 /DNA_START=150 /DNA_END=1367 /DNA_ORIENTATION=+